MSQVLTVFVESNLFILPKLIFVPKKYLLTIQQENNYISVLEHYTKNVNLIGNVSFFVIFYVSRKFIIFLCKCKSQILQHPSKFQQVSLVSLFGRHQENQRAPVMTYIILPTSSSWDTAFYPVQILVDSYVYVPKFGYMIF